MKMTQGRMKTIIRLGSFWWAAVLVAESAPHAVAIRGGGDGEFHPSRRVTSRLYLSPEKPPPDSVFQGVLNTGGEQFYIYRDQTRFEQWRGRFVPTYSKAQTEENAAFSESARLSRAPVDVSLALALFDPPLWALLPALLLAFALLGYLVENHPVPEKQTARVRPQRGLFERVPFIFRTPRAKPLQPTSWIDPWTPARNPPKPFSTAVASPSHPDESYFRGSIEVVPLESVLQILENEKKTGAVFVKYENGNAAGAFHFRNGEIISVRSGGLKGEGAACKLLSLGKGFYDLRKCIGLPPCSDKTWSPTALMLEAHRMMDEQRA